VTIHTGGVMMGAVDAHGASRRGAHVCARLFYPTGGRTSETTSGEEGAPEACFGVRSVSHLHSGLPTLGPHRPPAAHPPSAPPLTRRSTTGPG
jgi:hypothetical protein